MRKSGNPWKLTNRITVWTFICITSLSILALSSSGVLAKDIVSPFGILPAAVLPPSAYGLNNPYDYAKDLGVKWDRTLMFPWVEIQPNTKKPAYNWAGTDRLIKDIPPGIHPMGNLLIVPPEDPNYEKFAIKGSFLPINLKAFKQFVKATVERYDGDGIDDMPDLRVPVKVWQVDNEPPHGLQDYAKFLKITYRAIKKADPEALVLIGGVPGMPPVSDYLECFDKFYLPILDELAESKEPSFDIFDIHWYGDATGDYLGIRLVLQHIQEKLAERELTPEHGIWITEMGTYSGDPIVCPMLGTNHDFPFQTETQQAIDVIKRYVFSLSLGIKKVFLAFGITEGFKYDEGYFDFTGLVYDGKYKHDLGKGVKKLSWYTYKFMVETLEGSDWNDIKTIQDNDGIFVFQFIKQGKPVWVAWNDKPEETFCTIQNISSKQVEIIEALPRAKFGKNVSDYSRAFRKKKLEVTGGQIAFPLRNTPVYIKAAIEGDTISQKIVEKYIENFLSTHKLDGFTAKKDTLGRTIVYDRHGKIVPLERIIPSPAPNISPEKIEQTIAIFLEKHSKDGYTTEKDPTGKTLVYDSQGNLVPLYRIMNHEMFDTNPFLHFPEKQ